MKSKDRKKFRRFLILTLMVISLTVTVVNPFGKVRLHYSIYNKDAVIVLSPEDAKVIRDMLSCRLYVFPGGGSPYCGYSSEVCLQVGLHKFAIAQDMCPAVLDMATMRYLELRDDEIKYVHALFEKYNAQFPSI